MLFGHQNDNQNFNSSDSTSNDFLPSEDSSQTGTPQGFGLSPSQDDTTIHDDNDQAMTSEDASSPDSVNPVDAPQEVTSDSNKTEADSDKHKNPQNDELMALKQQALDHLTPLVDHLDQTPEERFRTTMMMIQSTDNHNLIKDAFAAAKEISDDKARAQALLDVINEINYFSQKDSKSN